MYEAVFISVFGVIFVFKLLFIVASVLFTIWDKKQESRRSSTVSEATTTVSVENFVQQIDTIFEESNISSVGNLSSANYEVANINFSSHSGEVFEDPNRSFENHTSDGFEEFNNNFENHVGEHFGEPSRSYRSYNDEGFEESNSFGSHSNWGSGEHIGSMSKQGDGTVCQQGTNSDLCSHNKPVFIFNTTASAYNSDPFNEDSFV